MRRALTPTGRLVSVGGPVRGNWIAPLVGVVTMPLYSLFVRQSMTSMLARTNPGRPRRAARPARPRGDHAVIDRTYPLPDVRRRSGYLEAGHAAGKVVITIA
jgi:hypothetical protein